jgi:hypothetical protein
VGHVPEVHDAADPPARIHQGVVGGQVGMHDLCPQRGPDGRHDALEAIEGALHDGSSRRILDVRQEVAGAGRVLDVPEHGAHRRRVHEPTQRPPDAGRGLAPAHEGGIGQVARVASAAARQDVVQPDLACAAVHGQWDAPRAIHARAGDGQGQTGVHLRRMQDRLSLHVQGRRILGRVADLHDRQVPACGIGQHERPIPLAAQVAGSRSRHPEGRSGDLERVHVLHVRWRGQQDGVDRSHLARDGSRGSGARRVG